MTAASPGEVRVALSTASVYPESTAAAFEIAARLGYDGIELMVWTDPVSQDVSAVRRLSDHYGVPVLALHSPCLLITQRVWGNEPWPKLERSLQAAEELGARAVVVHPPFRWQAQYAREFVDGVNALSDVTDVAVAVENMYPLRARGREVGVYAPAWNPVPYDYPEVTLDISHAAVSGSDPVAMVRELGTRLAHVHLGDGSGSARDEHLVPGRGAQPCGDVLDLVVANGFDGLVVAEINTRRAANREERERDLAETLAFARLHLAPQPVAVSAAPAGPAPPAAPQAPAASTRAERRRVRRERQDSTWDDPLYPARSEG